jgi:hypothetical protein
VMMVAAVMAVGRADHASGAADDATRHATDDASDHCADRTGGASAFGRATLATSDNALSHCGKRRRKSDKQAGGYDEPGFHGLILRMLAAPPGSALHS